MQLDAVLAGFAGSHAGPRAAYGIEFADYRRYTPGDDLRRIDWGVYARLREPFVKTAPGEARTDIALLVDTSASMDWPDGTVAAGPHTTKLRHAQRLAAMLAAVALLGADTARLASLADGAAVVGAELSGAGLLPEALAELDAQPVGRRTGLAAAVRAHRLATRPADLAVLLSDALVPDEDVDGALDELRATGRQATLVHVTAPQEREPAAEGPVEVIERESGERRVVDRTEAEVAAYAQRSAARDRDLRERCTVRGITYVSAPTDVPALDVLFERAERAGLVGV